MYYSGWLELIWFKHIKTASGLLKKSSTLYKTAMVAKKSLAAQNGSIRLKVGSGNGVPFLMLSQSAGFPLLQGEFFFILYEILT